MSPRRLAATDAVRYARLRARMLALAPWAFTATPEPDERIALAEVAMILTDPNGATFAVDSGSELVAAATITRSAAPRFAHRARLTNVFVEPAHRGRGLGPAVVAAAIDLARSWTGVDWIDLGVSENSPEAQRLYRRSGFVEWGREPETTQDQGRRYDEIFMALRLRTRT